LYIRACLKVSTNHSPNHNNVDKTLGCCLDSFRPQPLPFSCYRCPNTNRESVRSSSYSALDMPIRVGKKKSKTAQKPREPSIFFIHRISNNVRPTIDHSNQFSGKCTNIYCPHHALSSPWKRTTRRTLHITKARSNPN